MSRRWYRHEGRTVFVGWDRSLRHFLLSVVELCARCDGAGEEAGSSDFCLACGGEGIASSIERGSLGSTATSLADIQAELSRLDIPFPAYVRADLEHDERTDAASLTHDYDQDPRHV